MQTSTLNGLKTYYVYDADSHRVRKKTEAGASTTYVYDAFGQLAMEAGGTQTPACTRCFLTVDALGSTRQVTDATTGGTVGCHDYLPFGEELSGVAGRTGSCWTAVDTTLKFTGKENTDTAASGNAAGLDYFGARYMSSAQGRLTSPDPKAFFARTITNPQKWNKYAYTLNNPLALVDPDGKEEVTVRAFIPERNFKFPPVIGPTWRGDGRSFDANSSSYRVQGQITIETDPSIRANPIVRAQGTTSGSAVDWWGLGSSQDATKVNLSAVGSRDANGNPTVSVSVSGSDPLAPGAPPAAATLTIGLPTSGSSITVGGTITPYPAWEIYATPQGGTPTTVLTVPTSPQTNSPAALFLGQSQTIFAQKPLPPPPDDCKKTGTCSQPQ